jgi:hypothetical protein
MIIITRQREALKSRQIKQECSQKTKDLNTILTKWKWGDTPFQTSQEFLHKFAPWVQEKNKLTQDVKALLERKGVERLEDIT